MVNCSSPIKPQGMETGNYIAIREESKQTSQALNPIMTDSNLGMVNFDRE